MDEGVVGGFYGVFNEGIKVVGDDWDWFMYVNDDDWFGCDFFGYVKMYFEVGDECVVGFGDVWLFDEVGLNFGLMLVECDVCWWVLLLDVGISLVS